jgi:Protein of unknown function (DUF2934)
MSKANVTTPPSPVTMQVPHEKIAMRAYDKWCKRGKPKGSDKQDWLEAEAELRMEMNRTATPTPQMSAAQRR